jgi:hypothetical protein
MVDSVVCLLIFQQSVDAELYEWLLHELKRRKVRRDFDLTLFVVREKYANLMWIMCKCCNGEFLEG